MKVFRIPDDSLPWKSAAVAIGFFDGVHLGHRSLISLARHLADERGLPLCILTFPSENTAIKPEAARISTTKEKLRAFEELSADATVLCDFSSVKDMTAADFAESILVGKLRASLAVTGADFRFGKDAASGVDDLRRLLATRSVGLAVCPTFLDGGRPLSSSRIRELLSSGDVAEANRLLGAPVAIRGKVLHGISLAGKQGVPTVNLQSDKLTLFCPGVYRSETVIDGKEYLSVTDIGTCPTVGGRELHAETHLIGFSGDLYGSEAEVRLLGYIRPEMTFSSPEELFTQIRSDIEIIKRNKEIGETSCLESGRN